MNIFVLSGITRKAGGLLYAVRSLCKALVAGGVNISVSGRSQKPSIDGDWVAWHPVPVSPYKAFGPLGSSLELRQLLKNSSADLVHQHGIWMDDQWAAWQWRKRTGRPVVISPHGMLDPWALRNSAWKKKLAGRLFADKSLQTATCIHALCSSEAESIRAYGLKNPIAIIPNGVDLPLLTSGFRPLTSGTTRRLLFLGRIHPKKGLKELISAWSRVRRPTPNAPSWELLIAGWDDGGHEEGLKAQVAGLGLEEQIQFVGPVFGEEKDRRLRRVDAFILPSFSEGLPMAVLEAWAYGLPVLMTDRCNLPEGFEADAALRIAPDPDSIAQGLAQLFSMPAAELIAMGSRGRNLVENQFTWARIASDMKSVYEWCMDQKNPPECVQFD